MDVKEVLDFLEPLLAVEDDYEEDTDLPSIQEMFVYYDGLYFNSTLGATVVEWSPRKMTRCAGICYPQPGGGCILRLSEPLLKLVPSYEMKNTLLHEMIHAWNITHGFRNEGNGGHGKHFFAKAAEINRSTKEDYLRPRRGYHITQYHTMIREVEHYLVHHWQCNRCGKLIKRAMNRRPQIADCRAYSKNRDVDCGLVDCGYHKHERACNGDFIKIKEPEKPEKKTAKLGKPGASKRPRTGRPDGTRTIEQFFKGPAAIAAAAEGAAGRSLPAEGAAGRSLPAEARVREEESKEAMRERIAAAASKRVAERQQAELDAWMPGMGKRVKPEPAAESSAAAAARVRAEEERAEGSAAAAALLSLAGGGGEAAEDGGASGGGGLSAGSRLHGVSCPVCGRHWAAVSNAVLNAHVDACLDGGGEEVIVLD